MFLQELLEFQQIPLIGNTGIGRQALFKIKVTNKILYGILHKLAPRFPDVFCFSHTRPVFLLSILLLIIKVLQFENKVIHWPLQN